MHDNYILIEYLDENCTTCDMQARTQDFEKGGSDYHGEGECVGGECAPSA